MTAMTMWLEFKKVATMPNAYIKVLVLAVKNGFYSFSKLKSIEFEVVLKVNEDLNRIELESKNSDDSIRWQIRSGSRDLLSSKGIKKL